MFHKVKHQQMTETSTSKKRPLNANDIDKTEESTAQNDIVEKKQKIDFFGTSTNRSNPTFRIEELPNKGVIFYSPKFLSKSDAKGLFKDLEKGLEWEQKDIMMFGKPVAQPRLICWVGDEGIEYKYSGLLLKPAKWTASLLELKTKIETTIEEMLRKDPKLKEALGYSDTGDRVIFNSCLCNLYRNNNDYMGFHSDDEKELRKDSIIASISLGERRRFVIKSKSDNGFKREYELEDGSCLLMGGKTQTFYKHAIPKTAKKMGPRINLTFRYVEIRKKG